MEPRDSDPATRELSLAQLLTEPIVQLVMRADGVVPDHVVALFSSRFRSRHRQEDSTPGPIEGGRRDGLFAAPFSPRDDRLTKASEAVRHARLALRQAERRFDRDCNCDSRLLMQEIRTAETALRAATATLKQIDRGSVAGEARGGHTSRGL